MELALLGLGLIWDPSRFFFLYSSPFQNENGYLMAYPPLHLENTSLVTQDHRREIHLRMDSPSNLTHI